MIWRRWIDVWLFCHLNSSFSRSFSNNFWSAEAGLFCWIKEWIAFLSWYPWMSKLMQQIFKIWEAAIRDEMFCFTLSFLFVAPFASCISFSFLFSSPRLIKSKKSADLICWFSSKCLFWRQWIDVWVLCYFDNWLSISCSNKCWPSVAGFCCKMKD